MFAALRKIPSLARKCAPQTRNFYGYLGRPREELSTVECWAHGLFIVGGVLTVPCWVLCHIKEYRGIDKPKSE